MTFKNLCVLAFTVSIIGVAADTARAQTPAPPSAPPAVPRMDLSVGSQSVTYGLPSRSEPRGFYAEAGVNMHNGLGLVVQVGMNTSIFDSQTDTTAYHDSVTLTQNLYGVRYSRRFKHVTPFAQILVGTRDYVVNRTTTSQRGSTSTPLGADDLRVAGVGVTLHLIERLGVRIAADYERVSYTGGTTNGRRFQIGGVFAITQ